MFIRRFIPIFLLAVLLIAATPASAKIEIKSAGEPDSVKVNTDPDGQYLDIYQRQFKYGDEDKKFRAMLEKRSKVFGEPVVTSQKKYWQDVAKRNGYKQPGTKPDSESAQETSAADEAEAFGPPDPINQ